MSLWDYVEERLRFAERRKYNSNVDVAGLLRKPLSFLPRLGERRLKEIEGAVVKLGLDLHMEQEIKQYYPQLLD